MLYRNTKQQELIIEVFESLNHPSAQDVYQKVHSLYPTIGRATVYRVLNRLCESGKVLQINREENCVYFDKNNFNHPHTYCVKCGKINDICFDNSFAKCYKGLNKNATNFTPLGVDFKIIGICSDCNNKNILGEN